MDEWLKLQSKGISKKVLYAGKGHIPAWIKETKIFFHFVVRYASDTPGEYVTLDDSRKSESRGSSASGHHCCADSHAHTTTNCVPPPAKPMELILGKKFKLEFWEDCLCTMRLQEVAAFTVPENLAAAYPLVGKMLRDYRAGREIAHSHCAGTSAEFLFDGHNDLKEIYLQPKALEFVFELISVEFPNQYTKENWLLSDTERLERITSLKLEGNELFKSSNVQQASEKYAEALGLLEQLILKEKPDSTEWTELDGIRTPLLMNYAQACLMLGNWYEVIRHCDDLLERHTNNPKALWKRARARAEVWQLEEAEKDFNKCKQLDTTLEKAVEKQLVKLRNLRLQKENEEKRMFVGKLL